jgi:hypothetical protein
MVANSPYIALNDSGKAIAVWQEVNADNDINNIYARTYDASTGWSVTATNLNNDTSHDANTPYVSLNDLGEAITIWQEYNGSEYNIYAHTYDVNIGWDATVANLNYNQSMLGNSPRIVLNDLGKGIAVWQEADGVNNIYARTYDISTGWSATATNLNNNQSMFALSAYVSLNSSGKGIAVWQENNGSTYNIYARTYNVSAGWALIATNLNNNEQAANTSAPYVTINNVGNALAIWPEAQSGLTYTIYTRQLASPSYYTQWNSAQGGSKQYMSTVYNSLGQSFIDIYNYDVQTNSKEYKTTMTIEGIVNHYAVYNKSDTQLYSAIITTSPDSLLVWSFNGSTAAQTADLSSSVTLPLNDAQWWVPRTNNSYIAAIGSSRLSVLDLVNASNDVSISASGNKLLWIAKDRYVGVVVLNDTVATPYRIDLATHPITITEGTGVTAPTGFKYESIATCGDYIAVGFSTTDATTYGFAQVALLKLDVNTNRLSLSSTTTTLAGQVSVNALARCCCCSEERPLLVGSQAETGYSTLRVLSPDLSQEYASTVLGNNVASVGWSCQGATNTYLTASSLENNGSQYTVKYTFSNDTLTDQIVVTQ